MTSLFPTSSWASEVTGLRAPAMRLVVALLVLFGVAGAAQADTVRVGALKFGTVNWLLDVIKSNGLDKAEGIDLEILYLANKNASGVALQAGSADVIVGDWIWVARQRAEGADYTFVPYSTSLGAIMVPADSPVRDVSDLVGRRLGIAGGPLDKSWLLLRGLTAQQHGFDAEAEIERVFAAPPLLNEQILAGRVDAVLNFWPFAARLEAQGLRRLIGVEEIARQLGIESPLPLVGFIFGEGWARENEAATASLLRAIEAAMQRMAESDAEWERLRPLMKAPDDAAFLALRDRFRQGIPGPWTAERRADARRLFALLAELGGEKLVGRASVWQDGTFWLAAR